jgi:GNAT superfamily N-acetyltransferase
VLRPFVEAGIDPATVFYFGESVLRKSFRGHGIGVRFFEERENHALLLPGIEWCAFCAVIRPDDHPARPPGHQPLDDFWRHRGYGPTGMTTIFSWRDVGDTAESEKPMRFWMKRIRKHGRPEQEPT